MDLLAIAALEAFDGAPAEEKPAAGLPSLPDGGENSKATSDGDQPQAEPAAQVSADAIDPSLSLDAPQQTSLPLPPPPRLSASLANILSSASTAAGPSGGERPAPPASTSPFRATVPLPIASTSSPTAPTSSEVTMVYYGPPERLSEDSGLIRCICPYDDDDGFTIQCESCFAWLHGLCVDISPETVPDIYTCPLCVSGGRIARQVEMRAARLQQLRKEAEDTLRRQRFKSNPTTAGFVSSGLGSDPPVPTSELDEEYELLARARGIAHQQSFDSTFPQATAATAQPLQPSAKPTQSPYYQSEQLPVQQHTLGPSPFLPPSHYQAYASSVPAPQQAKRASSTTSNASHNNSASAKRSKSGSPSRATLPVAGPNATAAPAAGRAKKRSTQSSLSSIPQNSVAPSAGSGSITQPQTSTDLPAPPPPKKRRSAPAKDRESSETLPSVLAPTSGSIATNGAASNPSPLPPGSAPSGIPDNDAGLPQPSQAGRKTRLATAAVSAISDSSVAGGSPSVMKAPFQPPNPPADSTASAPTGATSSTKGLFMSDDEDSGTEDRFEPWHFEYTPINYLRYADRHVEQVARELVQQYVQAERENIHSNSGSENHIRSGTAGSSRASPFGQHSRHSSARPSLLGANSHLPGMAQTSRLTSPVPSSGSSTPAYSSSGVAYALAPPCLPVILPDPPMLPSEFSNKLSVKPLATSSMSLAPPACTPFSGPTCVPSLMNPYPRPTIHGVFTSTAFTAGALVTFMHGEVVSGRQYRDDPINQWHDLGTMKCHTRGLAQPWDLVLDQRRFADESRFIRNGCHPNVFMKPVIVRKSIRRDPTGKKGRSAAKRKADQQRAVQEAGEFELVFGLYALQDIAKREELVLPFDWADDHVVHSLHTLLFSPSLVFPTMPSNVESETEDDGIPSTSSFTHLTVSQKGQIAQCTKHLYRLSRLASQTCLILLGTSICACEKRRDCSIAWLWKVACFSESSSARSRGLIQLQDFDLNGLRAACASALATDDKDWTAVPGANGRASHKKSSKKRRADLGALVGLARGWEKATPEPTSAIPAQDAREPSVELTEDVEEAEMQIDGTSQAAQLLTPAGEKPDLILDDIIDGNGVEKKTLPASAELEKADVPFHFVAPELDDQDSVQSPAHISQSESKPVAKLSISAEAETPQAQSPRDTRPSTAQSTASEKQKVPVKAASDLPADDSDSDITEPLPSDHSDADEVVRKPIRKSPIKEMAKARQAADTRKGAQDRECNTSRPSPPQENGMEVDEEEIVRPPRKKKALRKQDLEKSAKTKPALLKSRKAEEEQQVSQVGKIIKNKELSGKSGNGLPSKNKSIFGSGLPSFRTKKEVSEKAKQLVPVQDKKMDSTANTESGRDTEPVNASQGAAVTAAKPSPVSSPGAASKTQLDALFDIPMQPAPPPIPQSLAVAAETKVSEPSHKPAHQADMKDIDLPASKGVQIDAPVRSAEPNAQQVLASEVADEPKPTTEEIPSVAEETSTPNAVPSVRRVSFQAYKKRVSTVPSTATSQQSIMEEAGNGLPPGVKPLPPLAGESNVPSEAVFREAVVQSPTTEKDQPGLEEKASKEELQEPIAAEKSTDMPGASPSTAATPVAPAKPRLSFAAYRQRATTAPKQSPLLASNSDALAPTPPAPRPQLVGVVGSEEVPVPAAKVELSNPTQKDGEMKALNTKPEEEQEEGEVFADPNLEPGEVEMEPSAVPGESALGMRMGDLQRPDPSMSTSTQSNNQSYTPPSRLRSLTPPKPPLVKRTDEGNNNVADTRPGQHSTADGAPIRKPSFSQQVQNTSSSNANWESLKDRPLSPVMDRSMPESSRFPASGASPPSHPRGFGRGSPRNTFNQSLPGSKPPTGPRGNAAPWPPRGRANSTSGPVGRGADPIYGGGFGTAGSGGSSYRPGSGGRGDGPPPPRTNQPPSGPRALQGGPGFSGRGRGGRPDVPRDRGWGGRGGGRGGRERGHRGGPY